MKASEYLNKFKADQVCTVNGNQVWDYKANEDYTELRLISEPIKGSESFEKVAVQELQEYVGLYADKMVVVDETTGNEVNNI